MNSEKENHDPQHSISNTLFYRFSQFIGLLLGARFFVAILLTFALYVSTFFLFNQEESFRNFVFDFKVHGIIFCTILSVLAGGIINQFYDREKDFLTKPFHTKLQSFIAQKYFLYSYLLLNIISLTVAWFISARVFVFFLVYQFFIWLYSHKLSKLLLINNISFVFLTLYPFFGMLVYYKTFSTKIFLMAVFLFLMLLIIDVVKDFLTKNADAIFGYHTIANSFSVKNRNTIVVLLMVFCITISVLIIHHDGLQSIMSWYFLATAYFLVLAIYLVLNPFKNSFFFLLNLLRIFIFLGILSMLFEGILN